MDYEADPMPMDVPEKLRGKEFDTLQTGRWWIVELENPNIAAQGESREEALDKLVKRLEEYQGRRERDGKKTQSSARDQRAVDTERLASTQ